MSGERSERLSERLSCFYKDVAAHSASSLHRSLSALALKDGKDETERKEMAEGEDLWCPRQFSLVEEEDEEEEEGMVEENKKEKQTTKEILIPKSSSDVPRTPPTRELYRVNGDDLQSYVRRMQMESKLHIIDRKIKALKKKKAHLQRELGGIRLRKEEEAIWKTRSVGRKRLFLKDTCYKWCETKL